MEVPPNHPFWIFHYKPSILGYPNLWKPPFSYFAGKRAGIAAKMWI